MTALACFFITNVSAQTPYNPDSDSDNLIGINDVLDFLPLFGNEFWPADSLFYNTCNIEEDGQDCLVPESASLVFVSSSAYYGQIQLPDGETPKIIVVCCDEANMGTTITGLLHSDGTYGSLMNNFENLDAAVFVRSPSGLWRKIIS